MSVEESIKGLDYHSSSSAVKLKSVLENKCTVEKKLFPGFKVF